MYDALHDLVASAQFKKRENPHGGLLFLVKLQGSGMVPPWFLSRFFKLHKWYQIAQRVSNDLLLNSLFVYFFIGHKIINQCFRHI